MRIYYIWSGSLQGVSIQAKNPKEAVIQAVKQNVPCALGDTIRISLQQTGKHPLDMVWTEKQYRKMFPDLYESLDFHIVKNTSPRKS